SVLYCFFFFQAEDGIRDRNVTGVQTCALPISYIFLRGGFLRDISPYKPTGTPLNWPTIHPTRVEVEEPGGKHAKEEAARTPTSHDSRSLRAKADCDGLRGSGTPDQGRQGRCYND